MAIAGEARISALMMTIMIVNGANAGAFSPMAPTGIISNMLTDKIGLPDMSMRVFLNSLWGNLGIGMLAYFMFGGLKLWKQGGDACFRNEAVESFTTKQWITLGGITALVCAVLFFKVNVGMGAFVIAVIFTMLSIAPEEKAVKAMPWNAIMMVCGVSMLMELANSSGGLDIFTSAIATVSTPGTVTAILGFVTGVISAYSSSSGVVMPAFIPLVPGLIAKMGGGDAVAMVSAINVGSHVVDASPLSIGGALCIACAASWVDKQKLFKDLMAWGLSMSVVGAIAVWLLFTFFGL
jgi:di/tricarboxylate transporter